MKTSRRGQNTGGALNLLGILVVLTFATTGCSSEPNQPTQPFSTPGAGMGVSVYPEPPTMVVLEAELYNHEIAMSFKLPQRVGTLFRARYNHTASVVGANVIMLAGGFDENGNVVNDIEFLTFTF